MKVTYLKRREGKTTRAIKECLKTGTVLVVHSVLEMQHILGSKQLPRHQVITFEELLRGATCIRGIQYPTESGQPELIIDNADLLLKRLAAVCGTLKGITLSKPWTKADCKKHGFPLDMVGKV